MNRATGTRLPRILITVFTALAVTASFCLDASEPPRTAGGTGTVTGWVDGFIPSPAEEPALFTKTGDPRFTPPRTEFQRIVVPRETHNAASASFRPPRGTISNTGYKDLKNSFLKLRI